MYDSHAPAEYHAPFAIDSTTKLHPRFCTSGLVEDLGVGAVGRSGADGGFITGNVLRYSTMYERQRAFWKLPHVQATP